MASSRRVDAKAWQCHSCVMDEPTQLQMLIERDFERLGLGSLDEFVATRRAHSSWYVMARELTEVTGRHVHAQTLNRWYADRITVEVKIT